MKILKSYSRGFKEARTSTKIVFIIYGSTLLLGLIAAGAFNSQLTGMAGARMELYKLLPNFDFTVYSDFMNNYGDIIQPFITQLTWFGLFYFFFTAFFAGGILKYFEGSSITSKAQAFFAGSTKYFFRFLRLGLYVLFFQLIVFAIIALIFSSIFTKAVDNTTEPTLFVILLIWSVLHLFFFILISIISDYTKIILVKEDSRKVWRALITGLKFTFKKIYVVYPLYILLLIVPVAATLIYFWLDELIDMRSEFTVLVMLIIQQIFIWFRLFSKVWILGSEFVLFNDHLIEQTKPLLTQEFLVNESL
ncbi:MAG: hypothetical protein NTX65_08475 [Ignavibacteriales bacterium]|nr:hypothetical protein [Ignavibacteriales bacterium]